MEPITDVFQTQASKQASSSTTSLSFALVDMPAGEATAISLFFSNFSLLKAISLQQSQTRFSEKDGISPRHF
jgi:hypothetical protein